MTATEVVLRSDLTVEYEDHMGTDDSILRAMLVSTRKDQSVAGLSDEDKYGKLNFLMRNRHGTPFEHAAMTFRSEAPIFVYREWQRHRIGISINEQSGRYTEFLPHFYVVPPERPLTQVGKAGAYTMVPGSEEQHERKCDGDSAIFVAAWDEYQRQLEDGIAKEAARNVLPVATYSSMYWTCNPRSLMAFLSLRTDVPSAKFPSKPQWEINQAANVLEETFAELFPITHRVFVENGRVGP